MQITSVELYTDTPTTRMLARPIRASLRPLRVKRISFGVGAGVGVGVGVGVVVGGV